MSVIEVNKFEFYELTSAVLKSGHNVRFRAFGTSMHPFIRDGDILEIMNLRDKPIRKWDVVLYEKDGTSLVAHRVVRLLNEDGVKQFLIRGDALIVPDGVIRREQVLGRVVALERNGKFIYINTRDHRLMALLWCTFTPVTKKLNGFLLAFLRKVYLLGKICLGSFSKSCNNETKKPPI